MQVVVRDAFPAAHRIRIDARGTLEPVHVHHWRVEVCLRPRAEDADLARRARDRVRRWVSRHRGRSLNDVEPFDRVNPTAEEVARALHDELAEEIPDCRIVRVTIGEAAGFSATYWPRERDAEDELAVGI